MKLRKSKKGFTVVELVIVIAVIAVLAAILIPTFISLDSRAKKASDQSLVRNLNTALTAQEGEADDTPNNTMHDAVLDLEKWGYKLSALVTKSGEDLVWSSKENRFYLSKDKAVPASDPSFWKIQDSFGGETNYSIYAADGFKQTAVAGLQVGFDAGYNTGIASVEYTGSNDVVIRTAGDQTVLTLEAPNANVDFYGFAKEINVKAIKGESLHIYGSASKLAVTSGHVEVEDTGIVFELASNSGSVTNNGYIGEQTSGTPATGATIGGPYQINSLTRLEAFRDAVNSGNNFADKDVALTANIELRDGWRPIGEGSRDVAKSNTVAYGITTFFAGRFDGQNYTISNLNNKGFVPTSARLVPDGDVDTYSYGLFALVDGNAEFRNVKLERVDFDQDRYANAKADSVGALVGYSRGNITVENVTVSGSIKGRDAVSGIVGRVNLGANTLVIRNCTNHADIKSDVVASGIARIYKGAAGHSATLENNTNDGTITTTNAKNYTAGITVFTQTNVTLTQSGNTNNGHAATISAVPNTTDNSKLD